MDFSKHTTSSNLERYAFYWLLALLVFSAGALLLDARPPITLLTGYSSLAWSLLNLSWLVCGASAIYLTYQWTQHDKQVFGGNDLKDTVAFWFMIAAGLNLGVTGALGTNLFFEVIMNYLMFVVVAVLCLGAAGYLYKRWQDNGQRLFSESTVLPEGSTAQAADDASVAE